MSAERLVDPIAGERLAGFNAVLDYRLVEWLDGRAVLELDVGAQHLNRAGLVHGGVMMTLLDVAAGYSGVWSDDPTFIRRGVTLQLTASFMAQAKRGSLRCVGARRGGGKSVYMATSELFDAEGTLCAVGQGTFRLIADAARGP